MTPEVNLWRAVIQRAVDDAVMDLNVFAGYSTCSKASRANAAREKNEAQRWLTGRSKDFGLVCNLADFDPEVVYEEAMRLKERGWVLTIKRQREAA